MLSNPRNLESEFSNLNINTPKKMKECSKVCNSNCKLIRNEILNKEYSFRNILTTHNCMYKISKNQKMRSLIVRPAKLQLSTTANKVYPDHTQVFSPIKNQDSKCSVQPTVGSSVTNNVDCDDTSIEELACYFDLLVHIPKKMSSMAEMMYI